MHAVTWTAFRDELEKISHDRSHVFPVSFDKAAAVQLSVWWDGLDEMEKEAFLRHLKAGSKKALDFVRNKPKVVRGVGGEVLGEIPMGGSGGLLSGTGKSLKESGRPLRRAPKRSVRGEKFSREQLTQAGLPADPGMAQRVGGRALEGAGAHIQHRSTAGLLLNPIGVPLGGAVEGATKQLGIEARRAGHTRAGRAAYRHAGKAGLAGEIAGLSGLGTAAGIPLSAAGAAGGKILAGASHAVPAIEAGLHSAGELVHHGASDVAGTVAKKYTGRVAGHALRSAGQVIA